MLKTIIASYKTYLKNFPVILLFALPLLVLSGIEVYFEGLNSANRGVKYFISLALFVLPLVSAATDIAVYQHLFCFPKVNPFKSLKVLFLYLFVQLGLGVIAILPILLFRYMFTMFSGNAFYVMCAAVLLNMFIGIYFLARFNIILPLIVKGQFPKMSDFLKLTDVGYKRWLLVSFLVYLPYIIINYSVSCPYLNVGLTSLFMLVFVCFNAVFVTQRGTPVMKPVLVNEPDEIKTPIEQPVAKEPQKIKKPAPKKAPRPAAPQAPKPETSKEPKKEPKKKLEKPQKPVLKPAEA